MEAAETCVETELSPAALHGDVRAFLVDAAASGAGFFVHLEEVGAGVVEGFELFVEVEDLVVFEVFEFHAGCVGCVGDFAEEFG